MDKKLFLARKIETATFEFSFHTYPAIERLLLKFEQSLSSIFEQQASLTKVPDDASVNIPRFVLSS